MEEEFRAYLSNKKIDPEGFKKGDPDLFDNFQRHFMQMNPTSFTMQKLFLLNAVRRKYTLAIPDKKFGETEHKIKRPVTKPAGAKVKKPSSVVAKPGSVNKDNKARPVIKKPKLKPKLKSDNEDSKRATKRPVLKPKIRDEDGERARPKKPLVKPKIKKTEDKTLDNNERKGSKKPVVKPKTSTETENTESQKPKPKKPVIKPKIKPKNKEE